MHDERGMVLPLALMFLMLLSVLGLALLAIGSDEAQISRSHLLGTQALYVAEAGYEDAFNTLRANPGLLAAAPTSPTAIPGLAGAGASLSAFGTYAVQYQSRGANTVEIVSTGTTATGGAQRTIRATLSTAYVANEAVLTSTDLSIAGNPTITGTCGSAHTNGNLTVNGSPTVSHDLTASGTYHASGHPTVGGTAGGGTASMTVPTVDPSNVLATAQAMLAPGQIFQMKSDGRVLDGAGALITTVSSGGTYNGWKYSAGTPATFKLSGNTGTNGTYYFEGNATISGNPNPPPAAAWQTTIIATGSIVVSGNPAFSPQLMNTLLVAGGDISLTGNPINGFNGLIATSEQVSVAGNPTIAGAIIARSATSTSGVVINDALAGDMRITYNCGLLTPLSSSLTTLTWGP